MWFYLKVVRYCEGKCINNPRVSRYFALHKFKLININTIVRRNHMVYHIDGHIETFNNVNPTGCGGAGAQCQGCQFLLFLTKKSKTTCNIIGLLLVFRYKFGLSEKKNWSQIWAMVLSLSSRAKKLIFGYFALWPDTNIFFFLFWDVVG